MVSKKENRVLQQTFPAYALKKVKRKSTYTLLNVYRISMFALFIKLFYLGSLLVAIVGFNY